MKCTKCERLMAILAEIVAYMERRATRARIAADAWPILKEMEPGYRLSASAAHARHHEAGGTAMMVRHIATRGRI